jgi:hypothetical protein
VHRPTWARKPYWLDAELVFGLGMLFGLIALLAIFIYVLVTGDFE